MIDKKFKIAQMMGFAAPVALVAGLAVGPQVSAVEMGYAIDAERDVWTTGYGKCWKAVGGAMERRKECGDIVDSDGDGVPDDIDQCPDTPKGVQVDAVGCPIDSDGDGVPDYLDQCPNTPAGVSVDEVGCPLDSDGDGVPDYRDKCPNTRAGAKVDVDGCEIVASMTLDLVNDEFDFDSAHLKPGMKSALEEFAQRVKSSKGREHLMIVGYTDSTGPEDYNLGLSERRAKATADYLIGLGVDADMIGTKGMGESQPVASNDTRDGRARNRRVEIRTE